MRGDECPREQWESDPRTQERMKELGITREADLREALEFARRYLEPTPAITQG